MPANPAGLALRNRRAGYDKSFGHLPTYRRPRASPSLARFRPRRPIPERYRGKLFGATFHARSYGQRRRPKLRN
jgi:hypothetical protein